MNILFALMYLIVMIIYSPLLTAVALSHFYLRCDDMVCIFKQMIREKVAQARTQSHLIEVLSGIEQSKHKFTTHCQVEVARSI